jgi:hypothetical protein
LRDGINCEVIYREERITLCKNLKPAAYLFAGFKVKVNLKSLSGGLDSNQRPLAPHANTLPDCATTRNFQADLLLCTFLTLCAKPMQQM